MSKFCVSPLLAYIQLNPQTLCLLSHEAEKALDFSAATDNARKQFPVLGNKEQTDKTRRKKSKAMRCVQKGLPRNLEVMKKCEETCTTKALVLPKCFYSITVSYTHLTLPTICSV
eukprot:TRINITY_DN21096_c0_g1_i1.p1 TRINITY_DN21096_c0_g1~~TRINITY_DN21096_c0_g1_i1.p1  ORF type:complete len:115 (+),score=21.20 TRINITY_DN21096_c0_g1_i1:286-630(+)